MEKEEKLIEMEHKIERILEEKDRKITEIRTYSQREKVGIK